MALRLSQPLTTLRILKKLDAESMKEPVLGLSRDQLDQILGNHNS